MSQYANDPDLTQLSPAALDAWLGECERLDGYSPVGASVPAVAQLFSERLAPLVRYVRTMKDERNSLLLLRRSSDALAKAVLRLVENRRVDARSEAGDALIHWAADRTDNNADPINAFRKLIDDDEEQPKPGRVWNMCKSCELNASLAADRGNIVAERATLAARVAELEDGVRHIRVYFDESLEDCKSPGTRQTLDIFQSMCNRALAGGKEATNAPR